MDMMKTLTEMLNFFEDDETFDADTSASIANVVEHICRKKSDVTIMTKDLKIPGHCRSLVPPPVNMEIWQFLERRANSSDLGTQTIQRLLGSGIVPISKVAERLKTKNPDIKVMRDLVSKAIAILCNTHL